MLNLKAFAEEKLIMTKINRNLSLKLHGKTLWKTEKKMLVPNVFSCSSCFQKFCSPALLNTLPHNPNSQEKAFKNIMGKGENAGNQHFLLFP